LKTNCRRCGAEGGETHEHEIGTAWRQTTSPRILAWLDRYFSVGLPLTRSALNTLLLSLIGPTPVLALHIARVPGFWSHPIAAERPLAISDKSLQLGLERFRQEPTGFSIAPNQCYSSRK
jgi:hypothetical protein